MPNRSVYQQQADLNEQTARAAQRGPDWAVTMCFYAALHWVNDYAFRQGEMEELSSDNDSPHSLRRRYVKKIARRERWPDLEEAYELLYRASMTARYLTDLEKLGRTARKHYADIDTQLYFESLDVIKKRLS